MSDQARHASDGGARPGDRTVRLGALLFVVGVVGVLGLVVPWFLERDGAAAFAVLAALAPVGLAVALVGLLRGARAEPALPAVGDVDHEA